MTEHAIRFLRRMAPAQSHELRREFQHAANLLEHEAQPDDMPAGWNRPAPASKLDLIATLEGVIASVRADDSFEGFIEYSMPIPDPCEVCDGRGSTWDGESFSEDAGGRLENPCMHCGGKGHTWRDPAMEGAAFGLRARYRVGNSMGQGGLRVFQT